MLRLWFLLVMFFPFTALATSPPVAEISPADPVLAMVGEVQHYDISFLWFRRLAKGTLSFSTAEEPGTFRAVLDARTLGVAAWLTRDREQRYESLMRRDVDGHLRTISHSSIIYKGKGKERSGRTKVYHYDDQQREVRMTVERDGQVTDGQPLPMVEGAQAVDVLTAFFNFRAGYHGPLIPGQYATMPTFTRKGPSEIVVEILKPGDWPRGLNVPAESLLCRVTLDEEIFKTGGGDVFVWFDPVGRPSGGVVEHVLGMGSVRGTRVAEDVDAQ
jgi:hypothetical protein